MAERLYRMFVDAREAASGWLDANAWVPWTLGGISLVTLALSALLIPRLIARLPEDYYLHPPRTLAQRAGGRVRWWHWLMVVARNACGAILLLAGIAMLVLPGQGLLTVLAALALLDFPFKRELEMRLVAAPGVGSLVGWLRRRAGKPPLRLH